MSNEPTIQQLFDLSGKTALVTGGTGRLGCAIARALAEAGARVIVTSRDERRAQLLAEDLSPAPSEGHAGLKLDQMDAADVHRAFSDAVNRFSAIDILINNAHEHSTADWTDCTEEEFSRQLANVTGYFLLARLLREHAVQRNVPAAIVMMGSMYGLVASYPEVYEQVCAASPVSYHAVKGGILQMTRHLAAYWAKDRVRVNCLSPGPFPGSSAPEELISRLETKSPMKRVGLPWELKGAVVFLASDASSYVTGHNLVVDGGWTSW